MIRQASSADTDRIIRIWLDASRKAHNFIPFAYWVDHAADMKNVYLPQAATFVLDNAGEIAGFLCLSGTDLAALFISPEQQSRGYGKQLLQYAQSLNAELSLRVYKKNAHALAFYRAAGFRSAGERMDPDTGEIEVKMHWRKA